MRVLDESKSSPLPRRYNNIMKTSKAKTWQYLITEEPYYLPLGKEVALFASAYLHPIPVLLKGRFCGNRASGNPKQRLKPWTSLSSALDHSLIRQ